MLVRDHAIPETDASRRGLNYASATADPHPEPWRTETALLTQEGSLRANDVPGNTNGSDTRPSAADVQVWTHGEVTGEASWMREEGESCIMDLWVMPNKGQGFYEAKAIEMSV